MSTKNTSKKAVKKSAKKAKPVAKKTVKRAKAKKPSPLAAAVAQACTKARTERGLTQVQLAKRMKTQQSAIARVESGSGLPGLEFLSRMAKAMGMELVVPTFCPKA